LRAAKIILTQYLTNIKKIPKIYFWVSLYIITGQTYH
jgi:hypothetical protein